MTVVVVGCEKLGIGCSSHHLTFNYIQQTTSNVTCLNTRLFFLLRLTSDPITMLQYLTFLLVDSNNKNRTSLFCGLMKGSYSPVNQFKQITELYQTSLTPFFPFCLQLGGMDRCLYVCALNECHAKNSF
jgi:hypothetical protein